MIERLTCELVRERELQERYAAGTLSEAEADALELHALECQDCWAEIQQAVELRAALTDGQTLKAAVIPTVVRSHRPWLMGVAAAVLVMAIGGVWYYGRPQSVGTPVLRAPAGDLTVTAGWQPDGSLRLEWTATPDAVVYRVRLLGKTGRQLSREASQPPLELAAADVTPLGDMTVAVEAENAAGEVAGRGVVANVRPPVSQ